MILLDDNRIIMTWTTITSLLTWCGFNIIDTVKSSDQNILTIIGIGITIASILVWFILTIASYLTSTSMPVLNNKTLEWDILNNDLIKHIDDLYKIKLYISTNLKRYYILLVILIIFYLLMILFVWDFLKIILLVILLIILWVIFIIIIWKIKEILEINLKIQKIIMDDIKSTW